MKNLLFFISAALLLTSCGGSGFLNRKYTKGVYKESVSKQSRVKTNTLCHNKPDSKKTAPTPEIVIPNETPVTLNSQKTEPVLYAHHSTKTKSGHKNNKVSLYTKPEIKNIDPVITQVKKHSLESDLRKSNSTDSDLHLIIMILLAIILPPLACYLKEKSTNTWFWVTLILCLLSFSYFFFIFGGGAFLAAIVIALLYVLDVIS